MQERFVQLVVVDDDAVFSETLRDVIETYWPRDFGVEARVQLINSPPDLEDFFSQRDADLIVLDIDFTSVGGVFDEGLRCLESLGSTRVAHGRPKLGTPILVVSQRERTEQELDLIERWGGQYRTKGSDFRALSKLAYNMLSGGRDG